MNFSDLGLPEPIVQAVREKGYQQPSPIQAKTIPVVLQGGDLMASAQTGTGKTAAFVLPLLHRLAGGSKPKGKQVKALVVTPTRELAAQVHQNVQEYGRHLQLSSLEVFGGVNIKPQIRRLQRGVDILVATPGRLLDLQGQNAVHLGDVEILVLDEADRMLDMGFIHDIKRIQKLLPAKKQSLLFSATFSPEIRNLAKTMLQNPAEVDVSPRNTTVERIEQCIHPVDKKQKTALLKHLIGDNQWRQVLVFSRTKHGANKLVKELAKANIRAAAIHGNKSQAQRTRTLADFKSGKVDVMVATDIAARGIDIAELPHVVNFDLPHVPEDYVHRIGRTGRAGSEGEAVSLVCADEFKQLRDIERLIKIDLPRVEIEGFEPEHQLPTSGRPHRAGGRPGNKSGGGKNVQSMDDRRKNGGRRRRPRSRGRGSRSNAA